MKIILTLLAENFDDFLLKLKQAESFTDYIQIDLMDGVFVPTKNFPPDKINTIKEENYKHFMNRLHELRSVKDKAE